MEYYTYKKYNNEYNYNNNDNSDDYYSSRSIRAKGVMGLKNINNYSCFMNSSLQCLSHIKPLYNKIFEIKQLKHLGLSFFELLVKMYGDNKDDKYFIPINILYEISSYYSEYKENRQQGANEFISNFLTAFHEELNSPIYPVKTFDIPQEPLKQKFLKKYEFYKKNRSIIIDYFYGNILYLTKCPKCNNNISALFSIFNILELSIYPLKDRKTITLKQLIDSYSSNQSTNYTILCNQCKNQVRPYTKSELIHIPEILIIYINKVIDHKYYDNNINFPNELYLQDYNSFDKSKASNCYNLIGLIEHFGTESEGHYIAKCKNFIDGNWYKFDDILAKKTEMPKNNDKTTDSSSVMILFYQKDNI